MKFRITAIAVFLFAFLANFDAVGQGCVAVRSTGCSGGNNSTMLGKGQFEFQTNVRYFHSFRHFVGDVEQHERAELNTAVHIRSWNYDFGFNLGLSDRSFLNVAVPFVINDRSSNHYTDNNDVDQRFSVQGRGLGDMRGTYYHWLMKPDATKKMSLLGGIGLKLPTGDPAKLDVFHLKSSKGGDSTYLRTVDQAIQPGDGGLGISLEGQLNYQIRKGLSVFTTAYYLVSPQETSNVLRGRSISTTDTVQQYLSICDQYMARVGLSYQSEGKKPFFASIGGRVEGIPSEDVIGGSNGRRRPGYVVSVEPTVGIQLGDNRLTLAVPVALYRNRTKSVWDKLDPEGVRHGDAAFSDYFVNFSFTHRFGEKMH